MRGQLRELKALSERYRKSLAEAEERAQAAEQQLEVREKDLEAKAAAAQEEAASQVAFLREQLAAQRAEQAGALQRHEEEVAEMRQKLRAAKDRATRGREGGDAGEADKGSRERLDRDKKAFWEAARRQQVRDPFPDDVSNGNGDECGHAADGGGWWDVVGCNGSW